MCIVQNVKIVTSVNNQRKVAGNYLSDETLPIVIEFYQDDIIKGRVIASVKNRQFASQQVKLERGLYQIKIRKVLEGTNALGETIVYPKLVMAGEKYPIKIQKNMANMHGKSGTLVKIESSELLIGNRGLYYIINSPDPQLKKIKYWVPMQENTSLNFFVADATVGEIEFPRNQNDCLSIEIIN